MMTSASDHQLMQQKKVFVIPGKQQPALSNRMHELTRVGLAIQTGSRRRLHIVANLAEHGRELSVLRILVKIKLHGR